MLPRIDSESSAYDNGWEDIPTSGVLAKWGGGLTLPLVMAGYGLIFMLTLHGRLAGEHQSMELFGKDAVALGLASTAGGVFLHCHYFWGNIQHLAAGAVLGKILSLILVILSLGYLLWNVGVMGR